jgi:hypothetical protein
MPSVADRTPARRRIQREVALGSYNDGAQPDWDDYLSRIAIGKCEDAECEYCAENKLEPR